ncbi:hypothetical protein KBF38_22755 [bacterium]|nr:hypothetical protein [bacterium]
MENGKFEILGLRELLGGAFIDLSELSWERHTGRQAYVIYCYSARVGSMFPVNNQFELSIYDVYCIGHWNEDGNFTVEKLKE